uniref:TATA box binding protein associated factor (TAF) histone-like fold domain-containing protein n=1 Tax=Tetradesmus obliquus TaxID=3088 RepID=A0A383WAR0_TETOB|eukprot:jgi/Sobl393_1/10671/SZX74707.1
MSIIHPNTIKAIAQSVDIPKLSDEAAQTLAPDVEYRLREVVQEALKFAKHAKRTKLTSEDINDALRLRNVEPLYGFGSRDPAKFLRVATHPELMYVRDPELSYHELIEAPLPKLPREAGVAVHWLAVNGVQPDLPENTPLEQPAPKRQKLGSRQGAAGAEGLPGAGAAAGADGHLTAPGLAAAAAASGSGAAANAAAAAAAGAAGASHRNLPGQGFNPRAAAANASVALQLPLRHAVSRELQVYFDKIVGLSLTPPPPPAPTAAAAAGLGGGSSSRGAHGGQAHSGCRGSATAAVGAAEKHAALLRGAFASVAADPGLHALVPYFTAFIADGVVQHLEQIWLLERLLQLAAALLANPAVHLEHYLQQLLPAVVTCLVTRALGAHPLEDHWGLRRRAAALLASICSAFAAPHHNLAPRLCRVLAGAWLDPGKSLSSKYGAVVGLQVCSHLVMLICSKMGLRLCRVLAGAWLDPGQSLSSKCGAVAGLQLEGFAAVPGAGRGVAGPGQEFEQQVWRGGGAAGALLECFRRILLLTVRPAAAGVLAGAWLDPGKSLSSKYGAVVGLQALGPQVVRTLLIPHLEPFMSSSLFPAMADEPAAAAAAADSDKPLPDGSSSAQEQQQKQRQEQQQRREAWQVYGALLSAAGGAMYDLLIGQLQGQLPMHLLLARRSRPDMEWESTTLSQQVLKAVRGPGVGQGMVQQGKGQQQQQAVDGGAVDAAAADGGGAGGVNGRIAGTGGQDAAAAGAQSISGQQQQLQTRQLVGGGPAAAAARKRAAGSSSSQQQEQQPSVAEVLGDAWKEDSDVNATLGALLHLFGEDLLASLPLPQLAAVSI